MLFPVFVGHILKCTGGASVQRIGSLKDRGEKGFKKKEENTFCYYTTLISSNVCIRVQTEVSSSILEVI